MQVPTTMEDNDMGTVVKRLSVPLGLEEMMSSLTKEVLRKQPKDIYNFASEYFAKLLSLRENANYQDDSKTTHRVYKRDTKDDSINETHQQRKPGKLNRQVSIRAPSPNSKITLKRNETPRSNNIGKQKRSVTKHQANLKKNVDDVQHESSSNDGTIKTLTQQTSAKILKPSKAEEKKDKSLEQNNNNEENKGIKKRNDKLSQETSKFSSVEEDTTYIKDGRLTVTPPKIIKKIQSSDNQELETTLTVPVISLTSARPDFEEQKQAEARKDDEQVKVEISNNYNSAQDMSDTLRINPSNAKDLTADNSEEHTGELHDTLVPKEDKEKSQKSSIKDLEVSTIVIVAAVKIQSRWRGYAVRKSQKLQNVKMSSNFSDGKDKFQVGVANQEEDIIQSELDEKEDSQTQGIVHKDDSIVTSTISQTLENEDNKTSNVEKTYDAMLPSDTYKSKGGDEEADESNGKTGLEDVSQFNTSLIEAPKTDETLVTEESNVIDSNEKHVKEHDTKLSPDAHKDKEIDEEIDESSQWNDKTELEDAAQAEITQIELPSAIIEREKLKNKTPETDENLLTEDNTVTASSKKRVQEHYTNSSPDRHKDQKTDEETNQSNERNSNSKTRLEDASEAASAPVEASLARIEKDEPKNEMSKSDETSEKHDTKPSSGTQVVEMADEEVDQISQPEENKTRLKDAAHAETSQVELSSVNEEIEELKNEVPKTDDNLVTERSSDIVPGEEHIEKDKTRTSPDTHKRKETGDKIDKSSPQNFDNKIGLGDASQDDVTPIETSTVRVRKEELKNETAKADKTLVMEDTSVTSPSKINDDEHDTKQLPDIHVVQVTDEETDQISQRNDNKIKLKGAVHAETSHIELPSVIVETEEIKNEAPTTDDTLITEESSIAVPSENHVKKGETRSSSDAHNEKEADGKTDQSSLYNYDNKTGLEDASQADATSAQTSSIYIEKEGLKNETTKVDKTLVTEDISVISPSEKHVEEHDTKSSPDTNEVKVVDEETDQIGQQNDNETRSKDPGLAEISQTELSSVIVDRKELKNEAPRIDENLVAEESNLSAPSQKHIEKNDTRSSPDAHKEKQTDGETDQSNQRNYGNKTGLEDASQADAAPDELSAVHAVNKELKHEEPKTGEILVTEKSSVSPLSTKHVEYDIEPLLDTPKVNVIDEETDQSSQQNDLDNTKLEDTSQLHVTSGKSSSVFAEKGEYKNKAPKTDETLVTEESSIAFPSEKHVEKHDIKPSLNTLKVKEISEETDQSSQQNNDNKIGLEDPSQVGAIPVEPSSEELKNEVLKPKEDLVIEESNVPSLNETKVEELDTKSLVDTHEVKAIDSETDQISQQNNVNEIRLEQTSQVDATMVEPSSVHVEKENDALTIEKVKSEGQKTGENTEIKEVTSITSPAEKNVEEHTKLPPDTHEDEKIGEETDKSSQWSNVSKTEFEDAHQSDTSFIEHSSLHEEKENEALTTEEFNHGAANTDKNLVIEESSVISSHEKNVDENDIKPSDTHKAKETDQISHDKTVLGDVSQSDTVLVEPSSILIEKENEMLKQDELNNEAPKTNKKLVMEESSVTLQSEENVKEHDAKSSPNTHKAKKTVEKTDQSIQLNNDTKKVLENTSQVDESPVETLRTGELENEAPKTDKNLVTEQNSAIFPNEENDEKYDTKPLLDMHKVKETDESSVELSPVLVEKENETSKTTNNEVSKIDKHLIIKESSVTSPSEINVQELSRKVLPDTHKDETDSKITKETDDNTEQTGQENNVKKTEVGVPSQANTILGKPFSLDIEKENVTIDTKELNNEASLKVVENSISEKNVEKDDMKSMTDAHKEESDSNISNRAPKLQHSGEMHDLIIPIHGEINASQLKQQGNKDDHGNKSRTSQLDDKLHSSNDSETGEAVRGTGSLLVSKELHNLLMSAAIKEDPIINNSNLHKLQQFKNSQSNFENEVASPKNSEISEDKQTANTKVHLQHSGEFHDLILSNEAKVNSIPQNMLENIQIESPTSQNMQENLKVELPTSQNMQENIKFESPTSQNMQENIKVESPTSQNMQENIKVELPTSQNMQENIKFESPTSQNMQENIKVELPTSQNMQENIKVESPTSQNMQENIKVESPTSQNMQENLKFESPTSQNMQENIKVESPTSQNMQENIDVESPVSPNKLEKQNNLHKKESNASINEIDSKRLSEIEKQIIQKKETLQQQDSDKQEFEAVLTPPQYLQQSTMDTVDKLKEQRKHKRENNYHVSQKESSKEHETQTKSQTEYEPKVREDETKNGSEDEIGKVESATMDLIKDEAEKFDNTSNEAEKDVNTGIELKSLTMDIIDKNGSENKAEVDIKTLDISKPNSEANKVKTDHHSVSQENIETELQTDSLINPKLTTEEGSSKHETKEKTFDISKLHKELEEANNGYKSINASQDHTLDKERLDETDNVNRKTASKLFDPSKLHSELHETKNENNLKDSQNEITPAEDLKKAETETEVNTFDISKLHAEIEKGMNEASTDATRQNAQTKLDESTVDSKTVVNNNNELEESKNIAKFEVPKEKIKSDDMKEILDDKSKNEVGENSTHETLVETKSEQKESAKPFDISKLHTELHENKESSDNNKLAFDEKSKESVDLTELNKYTDEISAIVTEQNIKGKLSVDSNVKETESDKKDLESHATKTEMSDRSKSSVANSVDLKEHVTNEKTKTLDLSKLHAENVQNISSSFLVENLRNEDDVKNFDITKLHEEIHGPENINKAGDLKESVTEDQTKEFDKSKFHVKLEEKSSEPSSDSIKENEKEKGTEAVREDPKNFKLNGEVEVGHKSEDVYEKHDPSYEDNSQVAEIKSLITDTKVTSKKHGINDEATNIDISKSLDLTQENVQKEFNADKNKEVTKDNAVDDKQSSNASKFYSELGDEDTFKGASGNIKDEVGVKLSEGNNSKTSHAENSKDEIVGENVKENISCNELENGSGVQSVQSKLGVKDITDNVEIGPSGLNISKLTTQSENAKENTENEVGFNLSDNIGIKESEVEMKKAETKSFDISKLHEEINSTTSANKDVTEGNTLIEDANNFEVTLTEDSEGLINEDQANKFDISKLHVELEKESTEIGTDVKKSDGVEEISNKSELHEEVEDGAKPEGTQENNKAKSEIETKSIHDKVQSPLDENKQEVNDPNKTKVTLTEDKKHVSGDAELEKKETLNHLDVLQENVQRKFSANSLDNGKLNADLEVDKLDSLQEISHAKNEVEGKSFDISKLHDELHSPTYEDITGSKSLKTHLSNANASSIEQSKGNIIDDDTNTFDIMKLHEELQKGTTPTYLDIPKENVQRNFSADSLENEKVKGVEMDKDNDKINTKLPNKDHKVSQAQNEIKFDISKLHDELHNPSDEDKQEIIKSKPSIIETTKDAEDAKMNFNISKVHEELEKTATPTYLDIPPENVQRKFSADSLENEKISNIFKGDTHDNVQENATDKTASEAKGKVEIKSFDISKLHDELHKLGDEGKEETIEDLKQHTVDGSAKKTDDAKLHNKLERDTTPIYLDIAQENLQRKFSADSLENEKIKDKDSANDNNGFDKHTFDSPQSIPQTKNEVAVKPFNISKLHDELHNSVDEDKEEIIEMSKSIKQHTDEDDVKKSIASKLYKELEKDPTAIYLDIPQENIQRKFSADSLDGINEQDSDISKSVPQVKNESELKPFDILKLHDELHNIVDEDKEKITELAKDIKHDVTGDAVRKPDTSRIHKELEMDTTLNHLNIPQENVQRKLSTDSLDETDQQVADSSKSVSQAKNEVGVKPFNILKLHEELHNSVDEDKQESIKSKSPIAIMDKTDVSVGETKENINKDYVENVDMLKVNADFEKGAIQTSADIQKNVQSKNFMNKKEMADNSAGVHQKTLDIAKSDNGHAITKRDLDDNILNDIIVQDSQVESSKNEADINVDASLHSSIKEDKSEGKSSMEDPNKGENMYGENIFLKDFGTSKSHAEAEESENRTNLDIAHETDQKAVDTLNGKEKDNSELNEQDKVSVEGQDEAIDVQQNIETKLGTELLEKSRNEAQVKLFDTSLNQIKSEDINKVIPDAQSEENINETEAKSIDISKLHVEVEKNGTKPSVDITDGSIQSKLSVDSLMNEKIAQKKDLNHSTEANKESFHISKLDMNIEDEDILKRAKKELGADDNFTDQISHPKGLKDDIEDKSFDISKLHEEIHNPNEEKGETINVELAKVNEENKSDISKLMQENLEIDPLVSKKPFDVSKLHEELHHTKDEDENKHEVVEKTTSEDLKKYISEDEKLRKAENKISTDISEKDIQEKLTVDSLDKEHEKLKQKVDVDSGHVELKESQTKDSEKNTEVKSFDISKLQEELHNPNEEEDQQEAVKLKSTADANYKQPVNEGEEKIFDISKLHVELEEGINGINDVQENIQEKGNKNSKENTKNSTLGDIKVVQTGAMTKASTEDKISKFDVSKLHKEIYDSSTTDKPEVTESKSSLEYSNKSEISPEEHTSENQIKKFDISKLHAELEKSTDKANLDNKGVKDKMNSKNNVGNDKPHTDLEETKPEVKGQLVDGTVENSGIHSSEDLKTSEAKSLNNESEKNSQQNNELHTQDKARKSNLIVGLATHDKIYSVEQGEEEKSTKLSEDFTDPNAFALPQLQVELKTVKGEDIIDNSQESAEKKLEVNYSDDASKVEKLEEEDEHKKQTIAGEDLKEHDSNDGSKAKEQEPQPTDSVDVKNHPEVDGKYNKDINILNQIGRINETSKSTNGKLDNQLTLSIGKETVSKETHKENENYGNVNLQSKSGEALKINEASKNITDEDGKTKLAEETGDQNKEMHKIESEFNDDERHDSIILENKNNGALMNTVLLKDSRSKIVRQANVTTDCESGDIDHEVKDEQVKTFHMLSEKPIVEQNKIDTNNLIKDKDTLYPSNDVEEADTFKLNADKTDIGEKNDTHDAKDESQELEGVMKLTRQNTYELGEDKIVNKREALYEGNIDQIQSSGENMENEDSNKNDLKYDDKNSSKEGEIEPVLEPCTEKTTNSILKNEEEALEISNNSKVNQGDDKDGMERRSSITSTTSADSFTTVIPKISSPLEINLNEEENLQHNENINVQNVLADKVVTELNQKQKELNDMSTDISEDVHNVVEGNESTQDNETVAENIPHEPTNDQISPRFYTKEDNSVKQALSVVLEQQLSLAAPNAISTTNEPESKDPEYIYIPLKGPIEPPIPNDSLKTENTAEELPETSITPKSTQDRNINTGKEEEINSKAAFRSLTNEDISVAKALGIIIDQQLAITTSPKKISPHSKNSTDSPKYIHIPLKDPNHLSDDEPGSDESMMVELPDGNSLKHIMGVNEKQRVESVAMSPTNHNLKSAGVPKASENKYTEADVKESTSLEEKEHLTSSHISPNFSDNLKSTEVSKTSMSSGSPAIDYHENKNSVNSQLHVHPENRNIEPISKTCTSPGSSVSKYHKKESSASSPTAPNLSKNLKDTDTREIKSYINPDNLNIEASSKMLKPSDSPAADYHGKTTFIRSQTSPDLSENVKKDSKNALPTYSNRGNSPMEHAQPVISTSQISETDLPLEVQLNQAPGQVYIIIVSDVH